MNAHRSRLAYFFDERRRRTGSHEVLVHKEEASKAKAGM